MHLESKWSNSCNSFTVILWCLHSAEAKDRFKGSCGNQKNTSYFLCCYCLPLRQGNIPFHWWPGVWARPHHFTLITASHKRFFFLEAFLSQDPWLPASLIWGEVSEVSGQLGPSLEHFLVITQSVPSPIPAHQSASVSSPRSQSQFHPRSQ